MQFLVSICNKNRSERAKLPGVFLFWFMMRSGLADLSIGSAGIEGEG